MFIRNHWYLAASDEVDRSALARNIYGQIVVLYRQICHCKLSSAAIIDVGFAFAGSGATVDSHDQGLCLGHGAKF